MYHFHVLPKAKWQCPIIFYYYYYLLYFMLHLISLSHLSFVHCIVEQQCLSAAQRRVFFGTHCLGLDYNDHSSFYFLSNFCDNQIKQQIYNQCFIWTMQTKTTRSRPAHTPLVAHIHVTMQISKQLIYMVDICRYRISFYCFQKKGT